MQQEYPLVDGGLFANNPSLCAYSDARGMPFSELLSDPEKSDYPFSKNMVIISIGTGNTSIPYPYEKAKDWGVTSWMKPLVDILMSGNAETVDYQLKQIFDATNSRSAYARFNPKLPHALSEMDNAKESNIKALIKCAEDYIKDHQQEIEQMLYLLIENH